LIVGPGGTSYACFASGGTEDITQINDLSGSTFYALSTRPVSGCVDGVYNQAISGYMDAFGFSNVEFIGLQPFPRVE